MDIYHLETLSLAHLPEEALDMAQQPDMANSGINIEIPLLLNDEEMAIFAEVGQTTLYHA